MKPTRLRPALVAGFLAFASAASAQVLFTGNYSQNFDTLINSGTGSFTDNSTITGWYRTNGSGSSATDLYTNTAPGDFAGNAPLGLISLGTPSASDRALGSRPTGSLGTIFFGVRLTNNTASTINSLTISYTGEQWSQPQFLPPGLNDAPDERLVFAYKVGGGTLTDGTFTNNATGDFVYPNPVAGGDTHTFIDGNLLANQAGVSVSLTALNWGAGQDLWIRWTDRNDGGVRDTALGIDNLTITAGAIPEPSSFAALAGLGVLGCAALRRKRRA